MHRFLLFCLTLSCLLLTPYATHASDLDFLRSLKQDNYGEKQPSLDTKHISDQEVEVFVSNRLPNLLNIEGGMIEAVVEENSVDFDQAGLDSFIAFLKNNNLVSLNTEYYTTISTIITQQPVVLNQAPLDGTYRWLVEATVLISLHNNNTESAKYSQAQRDKLFEDLKLNKKEYTIQMQIRRDPASTNEHQIFIEHFAAELIE